VNTPAGEIFRDIVWSKIIALYDRSSHENIIMVDDLPDGAKFLYGKDKREFVRLNKRRQRILCKEVKTGSDYLFSPLTKIWKL